MKKLKSILPLFLMGILVSVAMTSCLSSDDDNEMSKEEKEASILAMSGGYNGHVYFFDPSKEELKNKNLFYNDSIDGMSVRYSYPDAAIVVYDFPVRLFFNALEGHDDMKEAAKESLVDLKIKYEPFQTYNGMVYYNLQPETTSLSLTYGGESHNLKVAFMLYTQGVYFKNNSTEMQDFRLIEGAIYDGVDSNGNPTMLDGKALYDANMSDADIRKIIFEFALKK